MKKRFNKLASVLICITFAVFLLFIKDRMDYIWGAVCTFAKILTPFIYAFALAYILNFPYRFLKNKVFGKIKAQWFKKINKPLSLILTYLVVFGLIVFMFASLIPQLSENIANLAKNIPDYAANLTKYSHDILGWLNRFGFEFKGFDNLNDNFVEAVTSFLNMDNISKAFDAAVSTATVFYNWIMAIILSIYMLASKDFLFNQLKRFAAAFLPTKWMPTIYDIINVTDDKCGKFMVGKILDSTIIGVLCFICMTVIGLPYAPLISVIVGVCNIIPFFGPFIGAVPSAALLLMVSPVDCLIFVIMIFVLQQIDGNIIGPKIVGSQVGLVGFWSLFSVMVAGGMFGIVGMILGTPIFAAIYTLAGKVTNRRVDMKGEKAQKVIDMQVVNSSTVTNMKAKVKNPIRKKENKSDGEDE